ncbi:DUF899 family protein [Saccharopolyspora sp. NPDC000359]|uniref:DUF899 family protein n=1 Tax=Saccharopolyspora sp. NPDC000359 TaxID=3154251 RepID=UPI00331C46AC
MRQTNLARETAEYVRAREELRSAEIKLMRHRERVAEQRRQLPPGPVVDDYLFEEGPADLGAGDEPVREVRLGELLTAPDRDLVVYHLMFGKAQTEPCPMCTMWVDGFNGIAHHVDRNVDLAVVAAADLPALREHARNRGWTRLRLLSAAKNTFKRDLASEDERGNQDSAVSVFTRDGDGAVRHAYSVHPRLSDEIGERGIDLLTPVWHLLDLTSRGRGDWYPTLDY